MTYNLEEQKTSNKESVERQSDAFKTYLSENFIKKEEERSVEKNEPFATSFKELLNRFDTFIMNDPRARSYIEEISKMTGFGDIPVDTCVEYVARRGNSGAVNLPKENSINVGRFSERAVKPSFQTIRKSAEVLTRKNLELSETERIIADRGFAICDDMDALFAKWWDYVIVPFRTSEHSRDDLSEVIKKNGKTGQYSVLMSPEGTPFVNPLTPEMIETATNVPLVLAFPEEVKAISQKLNSLVSELTKDEEKDYRDYFEALEKAMMNSELEKMEELWLDVDMKWVLIRNRKLVPVHMMEDGYYDPYRISPEFRMMWRTDDFRKELELTREAMIEFGKLLDSEKSSENVTRIDIGAFLTLAESGVRIDSRIAGQSVPNRPDVRDVGMKIFLDTDSMMTRYNKFIAMNKKIFSEKTLEWLAPAANLGYSYLFVYGHELGHPVGVSKELVKTFGTDKPRVEEGKATLFGTHAISQSIKEGKLGDPASAYRSLNATIITETLRTFKKGLFEDPTCASYVNESMFIYNVLHDAGIIQIDKQGKFVVDEKIASSELSFNLLYEKIVSRFIKMYKDIDASDIDAFVKEFADRESPAIKEACQTLNNAMSDQ